MSDHRNDSFERDLSGAPSVTLKEAERIRDRPQQCDGEVRGAIHADEQGAIVVRVASLMVGTERIAYFDHGGRARLVFLDRAEQPGAHASARRLSSPPQPRQSGAPRQSQPGDAGPLFGTPGCAAPACEESTPSPADPPASVTPLQLVCSKCEKPPPEGVTAIEGGTHYLIRHRNDASRPRVDFRRTAMCGKWRRAT